MSDSCGKIQLSYFNNKRRCAVNNNETTRFQINVDQTEEAEHILGDVLAA